MSVSPSGHKRKVGESNPIQPLIGRLVSNQIPEPVRLPSVQFVHAFPHLQVSQALVSRRAIQQLVTVAEEASRSAAAEAVTFTKPPKLSITVDLLLVVTMKQVRTVTLMPSRDMPLVVPTLHVVSPTSGLTGNRTRIASLPNWSRPVGP